MNFRKIISIHGNPRSGTSWLGQIFDSSPNVRYKFQPLFSYAFKNRINCNSTKEEIDYFYNELFRRQDVFLDQEDKKANGLYSIFDDKSNNPEFLVTKMVRYHYLCPHLASNDDQITFIAIVRHPCGVLNSWMNAPREFLPEWDFKNEWRFAQTKNKFRPEEYYGFHKWKEASKLFLEMEKNFPGKFKIIRYEDLVSNPWEMTQQLYDFCGLNVTKQTKTFLTQSTTEHQEDPYSVFKGKKDVRSWKHSLPEHIITAVTNELEGSEFERFLY